MPRRSSDGTHSGEPCSRKGIEEAAHTAVTAESVCEAAMQSWSAEANSVERGSDAPFRPLSATGCEGPDHPRTGSPLCVLTSYNSVDPGALGTKKGFHGNRTLQDADLSQFKDASIESQVSIELPRCPC